MAAASVDRSLNSSARAAALELPDSLAAACPPVIEADPNFAGEVPKPAKEGKAPELPAPAPESRPELEEGVSSGLPLDPRTAGTKAGYAPMPGAPDPGAVLPVAPLGLPPDAVADPRDGNEPVPPLLGPLPPPVPVADIE